LLRTQTKWFPNTWKKTNIVLEDLSAIYYAIQDMIRTFLVEYAKDYISRKYKKSVESKIENIREWINVWF